MNQDHNESPITGLTVERMDGNILKIRWEAERADLKVNICACDSPDPIEQAEPAEEVRGRTEIEIKGLDPNKRYYFLVTPESGRPVMAAERLVPMERSYNFRDLGGYETRDGHRVKWGRVFRSDSLARLTEDDQVIFNGLGISLVCDLRTEDEVEGSPDRLPGDGSVGYLHFPTKHGEQGPTSAMARIMKGDISWLTDDFMVKGYIRNIEEFPDNWGAVIRHLTEPRNRPLVFHCTGGKDRTGVCAALILLVLGASEETVIQDYDLSNVVIARLLPRIYERLESAGVDSKKAEPYFTAPRECILALLDHIRGKYTSAENYLITRAGISEQTLALLRRELLE